MRLSIIVPIAPAEPDWRRLTDQLAPLMPQDAELILVSSGAPLLAGPWRCLATTAGRARQMNHGASHARGGFLWFVHADTVLLPDSVPALMRFIDGATPALGWFDLAFLPDGPWLTRLNAWGANRRSHLLELPFGDQGLVLPATTFAQLGGFDEVAPYGEDHLLVWAAHEAGVPVRPVGAALLTSARKYAERGWARTSARHVWLTARQAWPRYLAVRRTRR